MHNQNSLFILFFSGLIPGLEHFCPQNPSDKREIFCDAKLKKLFNGKDKVGFLEIAKLLSPHFVKTD